MAGNKYTALGKRLADSGLERVRLTFEEMNGLCGLPGSAQDRTFWANTWNKTRRQAHVWLQAGYVVEHVSPGRYVEFVHDPVRAKDPGAGRKGRRSIPREREEERVPTPARAAARTYLPLTAENVEKVYQLAMESPQYGGNFALLRDVLRRFPENTDRELVAMKIAMVDVVNSTNLEKYSGQVTLRELTDIIINIRDFDARVAQGDPELVSQLARSNGKKDLFSFASKYCTYHNVDVYGRDDYSIFDDVVKKALPHYVSGLKKATVEKWRRTFDYAAFGACIGELLEASGIAIPFRRRKFDRFLWYANRKGAGGYEGL